jgi:hypothetical protein
MQVPNGITPPRRLQNQCGGLAIVGRDAPFIRSSFPRGISVTVGRIVADVLSPEELHTIKASDKPGDLVPVVG